MIIDKNKIHNILVIRFKGLGDILLSVPAIKALRAAYPEAKISVLINREAEQILSGLKFIDEIILFDKTKHNGIFGLFHLIFELRKKKFDMAIDLICYPKSALLAFYSGAKYRAGTPSRGRGYAYNIPVTAPKDIIYVPKVHLLAVKNAGAEITDETLEIYIPGTEKTLIKEFLEINGIKNGEAIGINPFTNFETRNWGIDNFAALSDALVRSGKKVVLLWGPGDDLEGFRKIAKEKVLTAPKTDIKSLAALLSLLKMIVTTNTLIKHLAAAVNTPALTIYGATNPKAWEPENDKKSGYILAGVDCQPCEKNTCDDLKCLKSITVEAVLKKLTQKI